MNLAAALVVAGALFVRLDLDRLPLAPGAPARTVEVRCPPMFYPPFSFAPAPVCGWFTVEDRPAPGWLAQRLGVLVLLDGERLPFSVMVAPDGRRFIALAPEGRWTPYAEVPE